MKKSLFFLCVFCALSAKGQFGSAQELVKYAKMNFSEKKVRLVKNGWKKSFVDPISAVESAMFTKSLSGSKTEIIIRRGKTSSSKVINSTLIYMPKSKLLNKFLDEFERDYNFGMLSESAIGYSEKNLYITITVGTDDMGLPMHEIKIMTVQ